MAKIKDLEDMATSINLSCKAMDHALKEKLGIAYEVVVQWRINKVLKRIKGKEALDGPERPVGGDPSRTPKRTSRAQPAQRESLHLPGLAPSRNTGAALDSGGPPPTPPANA